MGQLDQLLSAPASLIILALNIGLSFTALQNASLMDRMIFDVGRIRRHREWYRWVSSGFVHADPFHLFINMITLFAFGPTLEASLGTSAFLGIYFGALLGGSAWTWMEHFRDANYRAVGASGAISGLVSAYAMFAPLAMLIFPPVPVIVYALGFIIWSGWAASSQVRDGIGHAAHLGGALAGVAIVCIWWPLAPQFMLDQIVGAMRGL